MITTLGALRRLVREFGLDATMRNQAGFGDTGGASSNTENRGANLSPPGLGSPEAQEEEKDKNEERWAARRRQRRTGWKGREERRN